jgi:hypothetical protein
LQKASDQKKKDLKFDGLYELFYDRKGFLEASGNGMKNKGVFTPDIDN